MPWWAWVAGGLVLLLVELVIPGGFVVFFFGLGAIAVGAVAATGAAPALGLQLGLYAVLSVATLLVFRKRLLERFRPNPSLDAKMADLVGGVVVLTEEVAAKGRGKAEYRGTQWTVLNLTEAALPKGGRCRIEQVEGLTLGIKPEA